MYLVCRLLLEKKKERHSTRPAYTSQIPAPPASNRRDRRWTSTLSLHDALPIYNLAHYVAAQKTSYNELGGLVKNKEQLLACTPAIQPVSNKDLNRIASGFG